MLLRNTERRPGDSCYESPGRLCWPASMARPGGDAGSRTLFHTAPTSGLSVCRNHSHPQASFLIINNPQPPGTAAGFAAPLAGVAVLKRQQPHTLVVSAAVWARLGMPVVVPPQPGALAPTTLRHGDARPRGGYQTSTPSNFPDTLSTSSS